MAYQAASLGRRGFRLAADALLSVEQTAYGRSFRERRTWLEGRAGRQAVRALT